MFIIVDVYWWGIGVIFGFGFFFVLRLLYLDVINDYVLVDFFL